MPDNAFLDTNILIYIYSKDESEKRNQAQRFSKQADVWISTQVLNELSNVLHKKFSVPYLKILNVMDELEAAFQVTTVTTTVIRQAIVLGDRYGYSYFDNLMLASALETGCSQLYSEDMQHGQSIESRLTIVNPFLSETNLSLSINRE